MLPFAVRVKGLDESTPTRAHWVLAVETKRLLIVDGGKLKWAAIEDCEFVQMVDPARPRPVVVVQPATPSLLVPDGSRPSRE